jgi:hypothetical protein
MVLSLSLGKVRQEPAPVVDIMDVITGLIKGLELDSNSPGACANDLTSSEDDIQAVISDITRIIGGDEMAMIQLLTDGEALVSTLEGSNTDCKWSTLGAVFKSLTTTTGRQQVLSNVMANAGSIFAAAKGLQTCPTDLTGCGFQIAEIFRLVFNWGIQTPAPLLQTSNFLSGFLNGLQTPGSNGVCVNDLTSVVPLAQTIIQEVTSALSGNVADAIEAFGNVKKLLGNVEGFNSDCNFSGLLSTVESLATPTGWMKVATNVMGNMAALTQDCAALTQCSANQEACGESLGDILRLTSGWSLGPATSHRNLRASLRQAAGFLDGLLNGLETPGSNGVCVTDLTTVVPLTQTIIKEVKSAITGNVADAVEAFENIKKLLGDVEAFNADCNFSGLLSKVESLATPTGWMAIATNVMSNYATIAADCLALENCDTDADTCGENIGSVFRLALGWSLGPASSLKQAAVTSWFDGFLQGLQTDPNSPSECATDLQGLATLASQIVADIEKVASDYTIVFQLISDAKTFISDLDNFAAPCNIPALVTILESLTTPTGVTDIVNNFKMNIAAITMEVPAILNCQSNLTSCGLNSGKIVSQVLGWNI